MKETPDQAVILCLNPPGVEIFPANQENLSRLAVPLGINQQWRLDTRGPIDVPDLLVERPVVIDEAHEEQATGQ